jgi:hypothetical protein
MSKTPTTLFGADFQQILDDAKSSTGGFRAPFPGPDGPTSAPYPSPVDWRDHWIYFLMVDRFNNPNHGPLHPPFDGSFAGYQGGSFRGIAAQLPYLKRLGVGALWLSPVLENLHFPSAEIYHGYGIHNFVRPSHGSPMIQRTRMTSSERLSTRRTRSAFSSFSTSC